MKQVGALLSRTRSQWRSHLGTQPNPDRRCSPGAYYSKLTKAVICSSSFRTSSIRNVPESEKFAVEREYGMAAGHYGSGDPDPAEREARARQVNPDLHYPDDRGGIPSRPHALELVAQIEGGLESRTRILL